MKFTSMRRLELYLCVHPAANRDPTLPPELGKIWAANGVEFDTSLNAVTIVKVGPLLCR